ncbi:hypothetical protein [Pseudoalteromonas sp. T1lg22]|uniref:hypothetical protein n=1 Tax=Pseudoalteromonas sp. T1lg22 TaxID=2077096 RepID=UPI000CF71247|nr:hypothetical protein [Pseudoalteromonas sp. T1lg22]
MSTPFKENIREAIKSINMDYSRATHLPKSQEEFEKILDKQLEKVIEDVMRQAYTSIEYNNYKSQDDFIGSAKGMCMEKGLNSFGRGTRMEVILNTYNTMHAHHKDITNEIKQMVKHDWYDKVRFLFFRILTTAGVAGTAIGVAIFAHSLGYETALIKKTSPEAVSAKAIDAKELTPNLTIKQQAKGKALEEVTSTNGNN